MTPRRRTAHRLAVVVAVAAALAAGAGCAKDTTTTTSATTAPASLMSGGGSSTTEVDDDELEDDLTEVCGLIEDMVDDTGDIADARERMIEVQAASPADLEEDWDVILETLDDLEQLSPGEDAEAEEIMTAPEVLDAGTRLDDFAQEECGVDLGLGEDDLLGEAPGTTVEPGERPSEDGVDPTSSSSLQTHFDETYGAEDWWPLLEDASAWDRSHGVGLVQWTVTLSPSIDVASLAAEDLVAACDAMYGYLDQYEEEVITVEILDADDDPLVKGVDNHPCRER